MKYGSDGFSLLELLVYFFLLNLFFLLLFQFLSTNVIRLSGGDKLMQAHIAGHVVCDLLARDIKAATTDDRRWKITSELMIWSVGQQDVGWSLENDELFRMVGDYNFQQNRWRNVVKAYLVSNIKRLSLMQQRSDNRITQVVCILQSGSMQPIIREIKLKNRVLA